MSETKREMSDQEIDRILSEYRAQKAAAQGDQENTSPDHRPSKEKPFILRCLLGFFKCIENFIYKVAEAMDKQVEQPTKWWGKLLSGFLNLWINLRTKAASYAERKRICPYVVDALYFTVRNQLFAILLFIVMYIILSLIYRNFLLFSQILFYLWATLPLLISLMITVSNRVVPLYILDCLTFKRVVKRNVELSIMGIQITVGRFGSYTGKDISYLPYFFDYAPVPCYFFYIPLAKDHVPKSSKLKKPPQFYKFKDSPQGKEWRTVRFIMTTRKSKQIDKLFKLEPTAEFEIRYLLFSKILREIRPIEGYEYAEGVPEILERINKMYP